MINTSDYCIFCGKKLTNSEKKGKGEHIIPVYLDGIITIKDVCKSCNNYFGNNIDLLLLKDQRIIKAVTELNNTNAIRIISENNPTVVIDAHDGREINAKFKNNKLYISSEDKENDFLEMDESTFKNYLKGQIIKGISKGIIAKDRLEHFDKTEWPNYEKAEINKFYSPAIPGVKLLKRNISHSVTKFAIDSNAVKRSISKIAYEFIWLVSNFIPEIINHISEGWEILKEISLNMQNIPDSMFSCLNEEKKITSKHTIIMELPEKFPHHVWINIFLYNIAGFRIFLKSDNNIPLFIQLEDGTKIDMVGIALEFIPNEEKKKILGYRIKSTDKWISLNVTNSL